MKKAALTKSTKHFLADQNGSATPLLIGFAIIFIVVGGLAVDYNKAVAERTQLQLATDTAAHTGLYTWTQTIADIDESRQTALSMTFGMLPEVAYRDAMATGDIEFGFWNPVTGTFTEDETFVEDKDDPRASAVRAFAELEPERGNASRNIFLSIIGQDTFTVRASTIYASYYPPCFNEGFVANGIVDMQSNSNYTDGFCIHSNTYVSLNQNNFFEPGTVVSMPNLAELDIPSSGFEKNEGLQAALRQGRYRLRILNELPNMFASLRAGSSAFADVAGVAGPVDVLYPLDLPTNGNGGPTQAQIDYAVSELANDNIAAYESLPTFEFDNGKKTLTPDSFPAANRIYRIDCSGNGDITLSAGTFSSFALVTNCPVKTSNGTVLDEVLLATEGDVSASHLQIGLDDSCAPGGGASIWTYGDFNAASGLQGFGAQMLALGDIDFAAQADGIEGVSFIADGEINGTSQNDMGFCGDGGGTDDFTKEPYFRMVN